MNSNMNLLFSLYYSNPDSVVENRLKELYNNWEGTKLRKEGKVDQNVL